MAGQLDQLKYKSEELLTIREYFNKVTDFRYHIRLNLILADKLCSEQK